MGNINVILPHMQANTLHFESPSPGTPLSHPALVALPCPALPAAAHAPPRPLTTALDCTLELIQSSQHSSSRRRGVSLSRAAVEDQVARAWTAATSTGAARG